MKPPYDITPLILKLVASISEKIGEVNATFLDRPSPQLRKQNKIRTIHASLRIEGNTLTEENISALLDNKRIIGPKKDVLEVLNAIKIYEQLDNYHPESATDFLAAHAQLMDGLIDRAGKYRLQGVGVFQGDRIAHLAPPAANVPFLMNDLFAYLQNEDELTLIKSCVFHYEMEFIHPFLDGNGRMGRLWQTLILFNQYPVFEFLPFETLISQTQQEYYEVLSQCDKARKSTVFIEYMLRIIDHSLAELLQNAPHQTTETDRLRYFIALGKQNFSRKDYQTIFKNISPATASRDLKHGIEQGFLSKSGEKNKTVYNVLKRD
jgi:Fic family protein